MEPFFGQRLSPASESQTASATSSPQPAGFHSYFQAITNPDSAWEQPQSQSAVAEQQAPIDTPQIQLEQQNGRVTKIVVTCKCCERIELDCEY